jgi:hypothetical protein
MDLRFLHHSSFHRAASAMVALGAGLSLVAVPVAARLHIAAPLLGGALAIGAGAGLAYGATRKRLALGALACVPVALSATWGALGMTALVLGVAVALASESRRRAALTVAVAAGAVLLAGWAGLRVFYAHETASWSPYLRALAGGAAMGMIGVLATLPRHLAWQVDAVRAASAALPTALDAEVRQLCERSLALWDKAKQRLTQDASSQALLESGVLKVMEVAGRVANVEQTPQGEQELAGRIAELERRIAAASDAETKTQYAAALAGLEDQRTYHARLRAGRERLVARLHNHVAALEKFHLAAVTLATSKTLAGDEPIGKQLAELSSDVSASGEALAEVAL